jgi:hypothetical protein
MTANDRMKWAALLAAAGTAFAGYLGGVKLFTDTCAFNEPCPYFLGYPACWYGFALFLALLIVAVMALRGRLAEPKAWRWLTGVAALGTVFAGRYVVEEVVGWLTVGRFQGYGLGLPTCVYGLVFYVLILALAAPRLRNETKP